MQRLYEFVFSKATDVDLSFKLCKAIPLEDVVCSDTITIDAAGLGISCTLVIQAADGDVLNLLKDQKDAEVRYENNVVMFCKVLFWLMMFF